MRATPIEPKGIPQGHIGPVNPGMGKAAGGVSGPKNDDADTGIYDYAMTHADQDQ